MKMKSKYDMLNPAELKRRITKLQNKLLKLNALKQEMSKEKDIEKDPFVYISTWGSVSIYFIFLCEALGCKIFWKEEETLS